MAGEMQRRKVRFLAKGDRVREGFYTGVVEQDTEIAMSSFVAMQEAQDHLPELMERVDRGEEIVIEREGRAGMRLVAMTALAPGSPRVFGQKVMGDISFPAGWEDDLPLEMFKALKDEE